MPTSPQQFSRYFVLLLLLLICILFFNMVKIFFLPALLAAVFATLFYPFYSFVLRGFGRRRGLSAFVCCLALLIGLLVPLALVGNLVSRQAITVYQTGHDRIQEILSKRDSGLLQKLQQSDWYRRLELDQMDWQAQLRDVVTGLGGFVAKVIQRTSGGAFVAIANVFATLFIMFYFFRDGEAILEKLKYLFPMDDVYKDAFISRFVAVSRASIKGTILIGVTQSFVGAMTLWAFGVNAPALWGVVMVVLSVIPLLGAWLVMHTAALIQILMGNITQGIAIFLITALIISSIDNILRPRLVGQFTGMHDLVIFFSAIGGIATFGVMGFIVGPVIAAFFVTILEIYSIEFRTHLEPAEQPRSGNQTGP